MAAPLTILLVLAVTIRAVLFNSSLSKVIAERVEVVSPVTSWKRGKSQSSVEGRRNVAAGRFHWTEAMLFNGLFIDLSQDIIRIHFSVCIKTCLLSFCDFIKLAIDGHMCNNNLVLLVLLLCIGIYLLRLVNNNNSCLTNWTIIFCLCSGWRLGPAGLGRLSVLRRCFPWGTRWAHRTYQLNVCT